MLWQIIVTIVTFILAWIPAGLFCLCWHLLEPVGFWQNVVTLIAGSCIFLPMQFIAGVLWLKLMVDFIWND